MKFFLLSFTFATALLAEPVTVKEWFFTTRSHADNVDSPAVWQSPSGEAWLLATTKATHSVIVADAQNGATLQRVGGLGPQLGQFNRPNGISVVDDLVFVVERDNQRVQVLTLPDFTPLTSFGEAELQRPYGLWVSPQEEAGLFHVYVTDQPKATDEDNPPAAHLRQRVLVYEVEVEGRAPDTAEGELAFTFGETTGDGRLLIVESIMGDPAHDHLLIAEEAMSADGQVVKVYNLAGKFTGPLLGKGIFVGQAEGIALYETGEKTGYWVLTDQAKTQNLFHVFTRGSLEHVGSFQGEVTLNTDGIWIDSTPYPRFPAGIFYAIHNDGNVAAFSWAEVMAALSLE